MPIRLNDLAVRALDWSASAIKLAHVRSMHLGKYEVKVNAVGQRGAVGDVHDVRQRVGNAD